VDLTALDWALFALTAFFTVVGLFQGFSGQLGSLAGLAAALIAGYFMFAPLRAMVTAGNWVTGAAGQGVVAGVIDTVVTLIAFGVVRRIVAKFVAFMVPQPMNAIAGGLVGLLKGMVAVCILTGVGFVQTGKFSESYFAAHSSFVRAMGAIADSYIQGAAR
jgi:uncharacterized membrane protein required for colicin V production